jgi:hypothetical protein
VHYHAEVGCAASGARAAFNRARKQRFKPTNRIFEE